MIQQSDEWLEMRKKFIGASDAPIILGESPWSTPYKLWREKIGISECEKTNFAMKRGIDLEPEARCAFTKCTGIEVQPDVIFSKKYPFMMASLDGIDKFTRQIIVEIKCPCNSDHEIALGGMVPRKYVYQLYHQMICAELSWCYYFSYNPHHDQPTALVKFYLDEKESDLMIEKESVFWECLKNLTPPEMTRKDYRETNDIEISSKIERLKELIEQRKNIEFQEYLIRNDLISLAGDNNIKCNNATISIIIKKGSINYKNIPELENVDLEKHRNPNTVYWKITI